MSKVVFIKQNSPEVRQKLKDAGFSLCVYTRFKDAIWLTYLPNSDLPFDIHEEGFANDDDLNLKPIDRIKLRATKEGYYPKEREFFCTVEEFLKKYKPNYNNYEKNSNFSKMKPTKTQKAVIDAIIEQLNFWRGTNDINSPTHYCDMDECYKASLEDCLSEKEIEELI